MHYQSIDASRLLAMSKETILLKQYMKSIMIIDTDTHKNKIKDPGRRCKDIQTTSVLLMPACDSPINQTRLKSYRNPERREQVFLALLKMDRRDSRDELATQTTRLCKCVFMKSLRRQRYGSGNVHRMFHSYYDRRECFALALLRFQK